MTDKLAELFQRCSAEMDRRGLTRFADGATATAEPPIADPFPEISDVLRESAIDPVDCLMAAAGAGLLPAHQPPDRLPDDVARVRYLSQHLERRQFQVRPARVEDLPALMVLERRCWARALRTPKAVLKRRVIRYPQGQLVLVVDDAVVGVIYSQCIENADVLNGMTAGQIDSLYDPAAKTVQLLAVNILPEMQQLNLGDQLLEFMLIYRSLQKHVESVTAVTLCRNFDPTRGLLLEDYIRQRNDHGVLTDPILRFHELHGATIERVVPGYRPADRKNGGSGVLVSYDIHRRQRRELRLDTGSTEIANAARTRSETRLAVREAVNECLGQECKAAFSFDRPLMEMGLDSAALLALHEKIVQRFRLPLTPTFFFQYNTAEKIIGYLCRFAADKAPGGKLGNGTGWRSPRRVETKRDELPRAEDVAIVGMACRLPGNIDTPETLWACLASGTSVIGGLPPGRWQWPDEIDPAHRHKGIDSGGFLDDVAAFDAPFFRISPAEAESMDPQQRLLLELCWQAIEHAGYAPGTLAGSETGVFIGASGSDYARLLDQSKRPAEAHYGTGSSMAVLANRISYFYDFHGPSLLVDTACSSSLVAVHKAVQSIAIGESSQALVGGINLILHPANSIAYYKAGMLSKDGLCKTFDQEANGYVRSEGAVVLLLKPLRAALSDRDRVYAVIKGTACNHGGQASGLTVPNPEQQGRLLRTAWRAAEVDPLDLGYIEAHGTGTSLGDPIEVQGIGQAFAEATGPHSVQSRQACGLGSVKTNLGHLEAAAGIAGLLKTVLCLQHRQLPASLHFRALNTHIDLTDRHFFVVDRLQAWLPPANGGPRLAGVSSFGSGGTNAHAVVAEYPPAIDGEAAGEAAGPVLFVLSAKTPQQLQVYARKYADWLSADSGHSVSLSDLAYQLQAGRQAMEERLALVVADRPELIGKLVAFCSDPECGALHSKALSARFGGLTQGEAGQAFVRALAAQRDLDRIALLWLSGAEIDWSLLYVEDAESGRRQRIAAPTYPFARHAYWLPNAEAPPARPIAGTAEPEADLHLPTGRAAPILLSPVWRVDRDGKTGANALLPGPGAKLLVIGGSTEQRTAIQSVYAAAQGMAIDCGVSIDVLSRQLGSLGDIDHILWMAPPPATALPNSEALIAQQDLGLLHIFRLVKALLALSYGHRSLGWTIVTWRTQAVFGPDVPEPAHAGVHGFVGALAKEFPRWSVRSLDMESERDWSVCAAMSLPFDRDGEVSARRGGQWFRRLLAPIGKLPEALPAYRQGGVYVVIGGAGGVGAAWTRHVIEHCRAQIVWIGRRPLDGDIEARLAALADPGPAPVYVAADASDLASLQTAYVAVKRRWPAVHGVIHAAVGSFDRGIADTDERQFRDILSAKIDASVHVARVFKAEPLDFVLYFSSIVALEKNGGLSGYAAGGAFQDALALHLRRQYQCPVKVINWGHWDVGTGAVISDATKIRLQRAGYTPIQPDEAMTALGAFLTAPISQIAVLKTSRPDRQPLIDTDQELQIYADTIPRCIDQLPPSAEAQVDALRPLSLFNNAALEAQLLPLFAATLQSLGPPAQDAAGFYRRWLEAGRTILVERGAGQPIAGDARQAWEDWEKAKRGSLGHADLRAAVDLVEACLRSLPDILSGRSRATDVIFPGASLRQVEGIYRDNAVADYFNRLLAESLVAAIEARMRSDPDTRLRILEIGAGTGGTTAAILPRLAPYRNHIAEYAYTDVSKAFLFHAEEHFVGPYPYVRPRLFDVEKPLAGQGIEAQHYDLAIAANVLHATRDIRRTLANCKAALRKNGLLLLNEISSRSLFAHLTFGLLEGWWLPEDQKLRMPDAPGLYPAGWQQVLRQEGFCTVFLPAPDAHVLGQQVIVAESDGIVWQKGAAVSPAAPAATMRLPAVDEAAGAVVRGADESLKAATNRQLRTLVAKTLRMDGNDIDVREPLEAYGIDSILIVQITEGLRTLFPDVPSTLLFECQTIDALSDYFVRNGAARSASAPARLLPAETARPTPLDRPSRELMAAGSGDDKPTALDAIAVIGMSCRFPQAATVDDYWRVLKSGQSCIREIPPERWALQDFFHPDPDEAVQRGKSYSKWGGFLEGVTEFDPLFFNIAPKEAAAIDPQERLFLQTAWETLEDGGYTRERLAKDFRQQLGVFVGITRTGFDLFGPELWQRGETVYPHTSFSSVANRLSYFLNVRGPSVPVDTMCSSSLTAIHQACQSLRSGECAVALAGGVNVYLHPSGYVGLSASRMLSRDGACRSFGKGGNGFVPGEGVAAVLLKPLSRAIADNDRIYATIRATHVNHGGKTNGYTVPNPHAQAELVREALTKAGVDARAVSYVEAHGTGTELGDPIEVSALTQAFRHFTPDTGFCALGSAKSNLGHLEAAAGIAGFIKVILQMRHGQLVPSLHAAELNPNIDFAKTPFVVQQTLAAWPRPVLRHQGESREAPRIAGISSFGAGGANAHVVVEEYLQPETPPPDEARGCVIVLSAKNEERLKTYAGRLHDFIARRIADGAEPALPDLAYTLQVGREQMDQRLALVAHSLSELLEKLNRFVGGADEMAGLHVGHARQHKDLIGAFADDDTMQETLAAWFREEKYARLLNLWTKGLNVDWERLNQKTHIAPGALRRISLPTYPFARTSYWLPVTAPEAEDQPPPADTSVPAPRPAAAPPSPDVAAAATAKPNAIVLRDPESFPATFNPSPASIKQYALRPLHDFASRPDTAAAEAGGGEAGIAVFDCGEGVFALRPDLAEEGPIAGESASAALIAGIEWVGTVARDGSSRETPAKVLLLSGLDRLFPGDDRPAAAPSVQHAASVLAGCVVPVIAVMTGDNRHDAMKLAAACDMMICSAEGTYAEAQIAEPVRGDALRQAGLTVPVVASAEIEDAAFDTARGIARASSTALAELKRHLTPGTRPATEALSHLDAGFVWPAPHKAADAEVPQRIGLASDVVTLEAYRNGVVVVTLHDRSSKNTFSREFVRGVTEAFEHINNTRQYKAVVLTGYDHYFACGGTKEGLLAIQSGKARFTDEQSYSMPLACEIPVIAAMQGHAIGAGWAMGLFCDWAVYSEESVYQSPYMLYGFTPGAGSTLIFPQRLGHQLSREILFTAREFQGRALKQRGIAMPVVPRSEVLGHALALANRLASSSRQELVQQKNRRSQSIRERLPAVFAQELVMHDKTFVGNPEVIAGIGRYFDHNTAQADAVAAAPEAGSAGAARETSEQLLAWLRDALAGELSIAPDALDDEVKFVDLGLDSVTAVTWIRTINKRYGLSIAATKVYLHPTLSEFHQYLLALRSEQGIFGDAGQSAGAASAATERRASWTPVLVRSFSLARPAPLPPAQPEPDPVPSVQRKHAASSPQAIAIIGMSGQFPKAGSVEQFWQNLVEGRDCISDIPSARWSIDTYYDPDRNAPGKTVCRRMGVLDDVDVFDPLFFNISPSEAEYMDPQHRLFLQNSWRCIEDAGYDPAALSGSLCGVFVGCAASDYGQLMAGQPQSAQGLIGESVAMLPARIAYFLNLQGPCLAIDTACSASLVAIANACDSLVLGNSDLALAGGAYVINGPDIHVKMSKAGMLSPDGRCFSFDQRANGFVPGEGVGVLLLKRLEDATRDGDDIYGVIRGWGVNQDGKTNGITAPNQESQTRLEAGVYTRFGIDPEHIQLVEAHGTGTKLGDPIEVDALCASFRQFTDRTHFCALGSAKSNIGHLATAAGVAGVIKSVLALQHRQLPPTINYQTLNEHIDLQTSPFYVNTQCRAWHSEGGRRRLAAVSSFGFSGTNAHMVLEEVELPAGTGSSGAERPVLLPLSAKNPRQLARYAQAVCDYLAGAYDIREMSLADIAYTFQTGRSAMTHRVAVVASTVDELRARLGGYASAGETGVYCCTGEVDKKTAGAVIGRVGGQIDGVPVKEDLAEMAKRWVVGETIDWQSLCPPGQARRKHGLPTYPFERERYWVPQPEAVDDTAETPALPRPQALPVDPDLWRARELPEGIDWQARLRSCLGRKLLIVNADDEQCRALKRLVAQLQDACGFADSTNVGYCQIADAAAAVAAKRPDNLLFLGGVAERAEIASALSRGLDQVGDVPLIVVFAQADAIMAERLGGLIGAPSTPGRQARLLVSQSTDSDLGAAMQRLLKEWLSFDSQAPGSALSEIHYAGEQRRGRVSRAAARLERLCLINKDWRPAAPKPLEETPVRGTVLVLVNQETAHLAGKLLEAGDFKQVVVVADTSVPPDPARHSINFTDPNAARIAARSLIGDCDDITHVVDLADLYDSPRDEDGDHSGKTVFYQTLIGTGDDLSILYVTKALQSFRSSRMSLAGARFAGLVKMLSADYRHVQTRCIDIDQAAYDEPTQLRGILLRELNAALQETELCYRDRQRFAPVLSAMTVNDGAGQQGAALPIAEDAVYVISGGTNGVGLEMAKHLASKGCSKLVLMGITPLPPKGQWSYAVDRDDLSPYVRNKLRELIALDKVVDGLEIYTGPLTDRHSLRRYFMKIRAKLGPIRGVIHSAAVYSDASMPGFAHKNLERMRQVWEPKADGIESLHAVFKADPLDFFVSFSSMTGLIPRLARGAGDYAMANSFVEFFTAYQRKNGNSRYKTIIWSDWNQTGAITRLAGEKAASVADTFDRLGMRTFSNEEGCALFELAMTCEADSTMIVGYLDPDRFEQVRPELLYANSASREPAPPTAVAQSASAPEAVTENAILDHLEKWEADKRAGAAVSVRLITQVIGLDQIRQLEPNLIHRLHQLLIGNAAQEPTPDEAIDYAQIIASTVMEVLKLKTIDPAQSFQNYGLDSISAMVLATRLEKKLKRAMQPQWLIEFPAVETLSRHLMAQNSKALPE